MCPKPSIIISQISVTSGSSSISNIEWTHKRKNSHYISMIR
ncbi:hypothetical protein D1AOALGA4SA_1628 [Olavius algarvensis Delta 1 endosymbiont]|nr:hypothetical protein D1AOALGA4SA_1628 [Olavius algarvensis Delta 1 endosymbiont]